MWNHSGEGLVRINAQHGDPKLVLQFHPLFFIFCMFEPPSNPFRGIAHVSFEKETIWAALTDMTPLIASKYTALQTIVKACSKYQSMDSWEFGQILSHQLKVATLERKFSLTSSGAFSRTSKHFSDLSVCVDRWIQGQAVHIGLCLIHVSRIVLFFLNLSALHKFQHF